MRVLEESYWVKAQLISPESFGPYDVGFRKEIVLDNSRIYPAVRSRDGIAQKKSYRPILKATWYPAMVDNDSAKAMPYREYLTLTSSDQPTEIKEFTTLLSEKTKNTAKLQLSLSEHSDQQYKDQIFDSLQEKRTGVVLNAEPKSEVFPLIINHPGLGGSYEECSLLFEFLASHGFVIISSAYQPEHGAGLSIDGSRETSLEDIAAILRSCPSTSSVATIGHSYGAQAALYSAAHNPIIDAVVSIDTTLDYHNKYENYHEDKWKMSSEAFDMPILAIAEDTAVFPMIRKFEYSERWLFRQNEFSHNEFLDHALIGISLSGNSNHLIYRHKKQREIILNFLVTMLSDQTASSTDSGVEILDKTLRPLNLHEIREALISNRPDEEINLRLTEFTENYEDSAFYRLVWLAYDLRFSNLEFAAFPVFKYCLKLKPESTECHIQLAESFEILGDKESAIKYFSSALESLKNDINIDEEEKQNMEMWIRKQIL